MILAFVHDHVFLRYKDNYYSNGKLTYFQLSEYLKYFEKIYVIGRYRIIDYNPGPEFKANGLNIEIVGLDGPLSKNGIFRRKKLVKQYKKILLKSDFLIARMPSEHGLLCNSLAKKMGIKRLNEMVASPFDCLWHRGDFFAKLYAPILAFRIRRTIAHSPHTLYVTKNYLQSKYPSAGYSCGISDVRISSISTQKKLAVKDKYVIGVIGNPGLKLKGIFTLFNIFKHIETRFVLSIVGGGLNTKIEREMSQYSNINQLGYISNRDLMVNWFESLDLYIQPSFTEGLPRSIIEAMAFGIPVIGSNVGGIPELVDKNFIFNPGDEKAIEKLIYECFSSKEVYDNLSLHSIAKAHEFDERLESKRDVFIRNVINK